MVELVFGFEPVAHFGVLDLAGRLYYIHPLFDAAAGFSLRLGDKLSLVIGSCFGHDVPLDVCGLYSNDEQQVTESTSCRGAISLIH